MEEKFYLDDFELSLREQANQFKMAPAKKVWHGIYNDLHPGRRWPSVMVSLVLLFSIVFIGYINSYTDKKVADANLQKPTTNNAGDISKTKIARQGNEVPTEITNQKDNSYSSSQRATVSINSNNGSGYNLTRQTNQTNTYSAKTSEKIKAGRLLSLSTIKDKDSYTPTQNGNNIAKKDGVRETSMTDNIHEVIINEHPILLGAKDQKTSSLQNSYKSLHITIPGLIDVNSGNNKLTAIINVSQGSLKNNSDESTNALLASAKRKNDKISWVYYAAPFISTVSFSGIALRENANLNLSSSPLPQIALKDMKVLRNAALGFEAGVQMNYSFAKKLDFTIGAHVSRSGYNVVSNLVHPTLATLTLRNTSTGDTYSRNFATHFGDGTGKSTVTLHNYSYQASIPVGLQYVMWNNSDIQVSLAASFEPSLVFNSDAFLLASNGKNYVNVPDLIRKWNMNSNFAPFVSFRSSRFKWNIGPNIRYQWLSTYQKNYTIREHLIDYGIRVGISK